MKRFALRCLSTFDLWRVRGYDGKPTSLRLAWELAGIWYGDRRESR